MNLTTPTSAPPQAPPPVIATVPDGLGSVEVCVRHEDWGVEVDIRPAHSGSTWTPLTMLGGAVEVRTS